MRRKRREVGSAAEPRKGRSQRGLEKGQREIDDVRPKQKAPEAGTGGGLRKKISEADCIGEMFKVGALEF